MISRSSTNRHRGSTLLVLVALIMPIPSTGAPVYFNEFNEPVGAEWSATTRSSTPLGGRLFLGEFGRQTVTLTLSGLPDQGAKAIAFDLFLLRTWDGNNPDFGINGPDVFQVSVAGGPTLLNTTFSNVYYFQNFRQSYPNAAGQGDFAPFTGAAEVNTLGYLEPGNTYITDSVYHFDFLFPHVGTDLVVQFTSLQTEAISNESWGLDNVSVTVPEASTFAQCAVGIGLLWAAWTRRRHGRPVDGFRPKRERDSAGRRKATP